MRITFRFILFYLRSNEMCGCCFCANRFFLSVICLRFVLLVVILCVYVCLFHRRVAHSFELRTIYKCNFCETVENTQLECDKTDHELVNDQRKKNVL